MNADQVLAAHGILRAAEVVQLARQAGLDLAAAATMLEKESGGGHNVFGHDKVNTGGIYVPGQPVTKEVFLRYKAARQRGEIGPQGVGPTQLTLPAFQDQADREGGCFDWTVNVKVGFGILAGEIRQHGVRDGFRAYNGSGDAAEKYAADAMQKLAVWQTRLGGSAGPAPDVIPVVPHVQRPSLHEGDTGPAVAALQKFMNATFPLYSHIDLGPDRYGPQTVAVIAEFQRRAGVTGPDADGRTVGPRTWAALEHFGFH
jgi:peptidoglycan hydrolase-like protein with peptidoglycan-binding domain